MWLQRNWFPLFMILLTVLGLMLAFGILPVKAHDWYDPACCSGMDCKPVHDSDVVEKPDGVHVRGWGVLHRTDPRIRTSRDDASHICEMPGKLYCVYMKPNGT
jgi:hypothetical protein